MPSTDASSSSLVQHLESLYPLARMLVGTDEARSLIRQVYENAAAAPPPNVPPPSAPGCFR